MSDYTHWYDPDFEGPFEKGEQIEKLKTANFLIKQVLEKTPDVYWDYARSNLTFPTIILRPQKDFKEQIEIFKSKGILPSGKGRTRDRDNEFNYAVDRTYSEMLSIKLQLIFDRQFKAPTSSEILERIDTLPPLSLETINQWEAPLIDVFELLCKQDSLLAESVEKKAREYLRGKSDSPSQAVIDAEIRAEFKKAIRRFAKERDSLLSED